MLGLLLGKDKILLFQVIILPTNILIQNKNFLLDHKHICIHKHAHCDRVAAMCMEGVRHKIGDSFQNQNTSAWDVPLLTFSSEQPV
jgi:hypothetical protein